MPRFDGKDAEGWIFAVRRYFIFNKIPEDQKLLLVSFHMDGIAKRFVWMEASNFLSNWKNFVDSVLREFTNLRYAISGEKLSKLVQEGSMKDY